LGIPRIAFAFDTDGPILQAQVTRRRQQPAGPHRQTTARLEKAWAQSQQEELARVRQLRAALPNASPQALDALVRSRAVDVLAARSAVIDAEPVGAGVDSEAVEIFEF
jgi:hypothetical protein